MLMKDAKFTKSSVCSGKNTNIKDAKEQNKTDGTGTFLSLVFEKQEKFNPSSARLLNTAEVSIRTTNIVVINATNAEIDTT